MSLQAIYADTGSNLRTFLDIACAWCALGANVALAIRRGSRRWCGSHCLVVVALPWVSDAPFFKSGCVMVLFQLRYLSVASGTFSSLVPCVGTRCRDSVLTKSSVGEKKRVNFHMAWELRSMTCPSWWHLPRRRSISWAQSHASPIPKSAHTHYLAEYEWTEDHELDLSDLNDFLKDNLFKVDPSMLTTVLQVAYDTRDRLKTVCELHGADHEIRGQLSALIEKAEVCKKERTQSSRLQLR